MLNSPKINLKMKKNPRNKEKGKLYTKVFTSVGT